MRSVTRSLVRALRWRWTLILYVGALLMIVTPIVFYPFAKALWLAIDLVFRPAQPEAFAT